MDASEIEAEGVPELPELGLLQAVVRGQHREALLGACHLDLAVLERAMTGAVTGEKIGMLGRIEAVDRRLKHADRAQHVDRVHLPDFGGSPLLGGAVGRDRHVD